MKAWLREHKELIINACLAGAYFGVATFMAADKDAGSLAAAVGAAAAAARFVVGYLAKHLGFVPEIPVDR